MTDPDVVWRTRALLLQALGDAKRAIEHDAASTGETPFYVTSAYLGICQALNAYEREIKS